jgi:hypothetical protein
MFEKSFHLLVFSSFDIIIGEAYFKRNYCNFIEDLRSGLELWNQHAIVKTAYYLITITYLHSDLWRDHANCQFSRAVSAVYGLGVVTVGRTVN